MAAAAAKAKPSTPLKRAWRFVLRWTLRVSVAFFVLSLVLVLLLRFVNPPTSAIRIQRALFGSYQGQTFQCWRTLEQFGPVVPMAVIATEDQRFKDHYGVDWNALFTVAKQKGRARGASTLTQQLAKNIFLWQGRSYARKALEMYFATLMEALLPKRRILELYLNVVEFGTGVYGACAGSIRHFGKEPSRLSPYQAGLLAASLPNPHTRNPAQPTAQMHRRASWAVKQMQRLGGAAYLSQLDKAAP
jgi:monofunctional glycosyltransferase